MGGGWYEIQQFVDNITLKNFNMVKRQSRPQQTTRNIRRENHPIACELQCRCLAMVT